MVNNQNEEAKVGAQIRRLRNQRGMTVTELGRLAGVTKSQISQIELGNSNASVPVLRAIARALGVPVFSLFADDDPHDALVRKAERRQLHIPGSDVVRELLVPDLHRKMFIVAATLQPGEQSSSEPSVHTGEECVVVLNGQIQIEINGHIIDLQEGDSYYFESTLPHIFRNVSDKPAEIMAAITSRL